MSKQPTPSLPNIAEELTGETLGNFRLQRKLGAGGMGTVYFATHCSIGSQAAIKVLHETQCRDPQLVELFYGEARAVNAIRHPNLAAIYDLSRTENGRYYLVMEYLEGESLAKLGALPMSPRALVPLLVQACAALHVAHARGYVHRDIKPDNLFAVQGKVAGPPTCKVLDFGVARLRGTEDPQRGCCVGSPAYMAPEQWMGVAAEPAADIYSLGMTAYRLLTGRLPWTVKGLTELARAHQTVPPLPPTSLTGDLSPRLSQLILKALSKKPEDRFQDAAAFGAALEAAVPSTQGDALVAQAYASNGRLLTRAHCAELTTGGVFLNWDGAFPPLFTPMSLDLISGSSSVVLNAEVVRHVRTSEAAAWGTSPGVAVQFVGVTTEQRAFIKWLIAVRSAAQLRPEAKEHQVSKSHRKPVERAVEKALCGDYAGMRDLFADPRFCQADFASAQDVFRRLRPKAGTQAAVLLAQAASSGERNQAAALTRAALEVDPLNIRGHQQLLRLERGVPSDELSTPH